jgi:hypothetical protein
LEPTSPETKHIEKLVRQVVPRQYPSESLDELLGGNTWMLRRTNKGRAYLTIVKVRPPFGIPGSGDVCIALLDHLGRIISIKTISTGNRMFVSSVDFDATSRPYPCITVNSDYFWVGWTQCQQIAVRDDRIAEVRIDHQSSKPEDGQWQASHHQLGPEYRFADHAAWSQALMSDDEIDILEALLYLPPQEVLEQRNAADIERLQALSQSSDAWICEGAAAALAEFDRHRDLRH